MGRPRKIKLEAKKIAKQSPVQSVRGMNDVLPLDQNYWDFIQSIAEKYIYAFGFKKIETPVLEHTELYTRGIGATTDIVEREMFTFSDRGGESLALRPEWTAGIVRAYAEHGMFTLPQPVKLYSFGPLFRHERPQAGRYRQFHQINLEILGGKHPSLDAQFILISWRILQKLGLKDIEVQINNIGCSQCRPNYKEILINTLSRKRHKLCDNCKKRLKKNPLRILDCKEKKCQEIVNEAPQIIDYLCENCHNHFKQVLEYLDEAEVAYNLNPHLVRGLDYYTRTVFEIWSKDDGGGAALAGGGRYDDLCEFLGGRKTFAGGVSLGIERIIDQLKKKNLPVPEMHKPEVMFIQLGEMAKRRALKIFTHLIDSDIKVMEVLHKDSIKAQLKLADTLKVKLTLILGQKELLDGTILIRDMSTGVQEIINVEKLVPELKKRLNLQEPASSAGRR